MSEHIHDLNDKSIETPSPCVDNECPQIYDAYFAKKNSTLVESDTQAGSHSYSFKGNNTVTDGNKTKIANIILERVNKAEKSNSKFTNIETVTNALTNGTYKAGSSLSVSLFKYKERVSFEYVDGGRVGQEIYLVVETEYFKNKKIQIDINQGKKTVIAEKDKLIQVLQDGKLKLIETKVGEWATNTDIENKGDFEDWAIVKVTLKPETDESLKIWEKNIDKTTDKKAYLYLLVDAHKHNPDYEPGKNLAYHGRNPDGEGNPDEDTTSNYWLDMEGKWFGLRYCDCGKQFDKQIQCTRYNKAYGPVYWGSQKLADYKGWDELIKTKKLTKEEKEILIGMSENEGKLDSVQSYDSEILTVGAMQKTVNPQGEGEFPIQVQEFKASNPDKYKELFEECGWTVESNKMYYKDPDDPAATKITGSTLKTKIRDGFVASQFKKKVKCKPLEPIIKAAKDKDFQAKQVQDFIKRLNKVLLIKPVGHSYELKKYLKSKLGKATALDHHINRPAYVDDDFGKALNNFFAAKDKEVEAFNKGKKKEEQKEKVSRNPAGWGTDHGTYEKTILDDYGKNRRGTDMEKRYNNMVSKF